MSQLFIQLLLFGLLAASGNLLGSYFLFPSRLHDKYRHFLKYLVAVGAGFMLGVTLIEILPNAVMLWLRSHPATESSLYVPVVLLLAGFLLTQFLEHTIAPHFHLGEEVHCDDEAHAHPDLSVRSAWTAVTGLMVHTFFDGVTIAAAWQVETKLGLLVFIAVFLHKFPEGFTVGSMVLAAGRTRREVMISAAALGGATLAGVIAFYFIGTSLGDTVQYALPLAGGVTLYVAASDLIPEVNHHGGRSWWASLAIFAGAALFFLTHEALHFAFER